MNGKQLKNSVLQWAIQGKLVPQNPKDEPACKLLERIAAQRVIASGAKQSKKNPASRIYREGSSWFEQVGSAEPKDITEEIPFDIPESWEWCRLESLSLCITDGDHQPPPQSTTGVPFVVISSINGESINFEKTKFVNEEYYFQLEDSRKARNNDILFTVTGSYGKVIVVLDCPNFCFQRHIALIRPVIPPFYLKFVLSSGYIKSVCDDLATGIAQKTVGLGTLKNLLIPLPPVAEQKRIVKKLEQILPLVDEYDQAQNQLDKLNKELPESLKKSILQQAIQGKLVPQNPKDEPADKLLERITISRHSEHSEESSKKSRKSSSKNPVSRIYRDTDGLWYEQIGSATPKDISEEIPFEIPENWTWAKLKDIANVLYGFPFDSTLFNDVNVGTPLIRIRDVLPGCTKTYTSEKCDNKYLMNAGDMLIGMDGNFNVCFWKSEPAYLNQRVCRISANEDVVLQKYLYYYLPISFEEISKGVSFVTVKHLSDKHLSSLLVPLPPLAEQKRIVAKLEQMFNAINP